MVRSADGRLEIPYSFEFSVPTGGVEQVKERTKRNVDRISRCDSCNDREQVCTILSCHECCTGNKLCPPCEQKGHKNIFSVYRQCNYCLSSNKCCSRIIHCMDQC